MSDSISNEALVQAARRIAAWKRPLLLSHVKPDGDALGSLLGMQSLLRSNGAEAHALLFDEVPPRYEPMSRLGPLLVLKRDVQEADLAPYDGVLVLDTCAYRQLEPIETWLRSSPAPKFVIDHHLTRDELADGYLIDERAGACCVLLHEMAVASGWYVNSTAAEALFVGIATDTGWFRYSNTDERVFRAAGDLTRLGASPNRWFEELYCRDSSARFRLFASALGKLRLESGDQIAHMAVSRDDFTKCGALPTETEDLVSEPLRISSVLVSVLFVEESTGAIRVSFRSRAPRNTGELDVDVAGIAAEFGGGGHRRAAGARLSGSLDTARETCLKMVRQRVYIKHS